MEVQKYSKVAKKIPKGYLMQLQKMGQKLDRNLSNFGSNLYTELWPTKGEISQGL